MQTFFDDVDTDFDHSSGDFFVPQGPSPSDYDWLLSTISDLCNAANSPYLFETIKREMYERSLIPHYGCEDQVSRSIAIQSPFSQVYSQIGLAGEGAYGKILKVQNLIDKQTYAIKQIDLEDEEIAYAVREVQFLAHLNSPRVVRYYSSWLEKIETGYRLSIQMEFVNGASLANILASGKRFTRQESIKLIKEFLQALTEIHSHGVIHRDFRPDNLMIRDDGRIVVVDFGISTTRKCNNNIYSSIEEPIYVTNENHFESHSAPTRTGSYNPSPLDDICIQAADQKCITLRKVGTPLYSSPRQLNGEKSHCKDDMYSLGIVFFELLGQFKTTMEKTKAIRALRAQRELPKGFLESMPEETQIILQLTDPEPKKRPSADSLLNNPMFKAVQ